MPQGVPRPKGIGTCPRNNASRLRISGALHLGIPYPVRDKLLNSLQKILFQHAVNPSSSRGFRECSQRGMVQAMRRRDPPLPTDAGDGEAFWGAFEAAFSMKVPLEKPVELYYETFEFLPKPSKSSFLRKQEASPFKVLWIPAFAGMTKEGRFSKVSLLLRQQYMSKPSFPRKRESRIGLDAGSGLPHT